MTATPDWSELSRFAITLARASEAEILPHFRKNAAVDVKSGPIFDPVTEGDRAGERMIRKMIEETYPDHGILGEEYGEKPSRSGFTWVLDPVDGTRAFICGMPTWATLIALTYEGEPRLGVMNQPYVGDLFYGTPEGAWLIYGGETKPIRARQGIALKDATAGTTAPELYRKPKDAAAFSRLQKAARLMRFGGDAYFFAVLAAGHLDIALDAALQSYDIAALIPIIRGAGGAVGSWDGGDPAKGGNVITAGSQTLLDEAIAVMNDAPEPSGPRFRLL
ncbi:MAG: histidinol-phosphatase [Rhizobiales bacterium]|nr:histidinol-phosphatase [Hyphomicrobiales bacterium]